MTIIRIGKNHPIAKKFRLHQSGFGPRRSKYGIRRVEFDGQKFDSPAERDYWIEISRAKNFPDRRLTAAGIIDKIERQPKYTLIPKFTDAAGTKHRAVQFTPDFLITYKDGHTEIHEVKGFKTKDYILRMKLFLFQNQSVIFKEIRREDLRDSQ